MERQISVEGLLAKPYQNYGTTSDCGDMASLPSMRNSSGSDATTAVVVFSTLVAVSGSFCYGIAVGYSSPAEAGIMEDLGLSIAAYSVFGSIMTIGGMLGAILSGKIADIFGRRNVMWLAELICTLGWLAIAFAKDALWLDSGRLLIGFGAGIISYVIPIYVAEISPKDFRGVFTAFHQLMNTFGCSLAYFFGNVIPWRVLALIGVIPCVLQLIGLFFIPESPRWLVKIGNEKEFETTLQNLRGKGADISQEAAEIRDHIEISQKHSEARLLNLFQRRYANSLIIGVGLMLLQQFGGASAMAYYTSSIFEKAGASGSIGSRGIAIIQIPAVITSVLLMDKAGRKPLLMISACGMAFGCFLIGLSFYLKEVKNMNDAAHILVLVGFMGCSAFNSIGLAGIPFVIMSEIFPINVKASAGSLVILICWSCSWIVTYTFNFMMQWSSAGTFFIFSGIGFFTVLFVAKIVPETKGRTLEEIQDSIITSFAGLR
ncbi:Sugar transporter ERD6-like 5 [Citrus sinensis]|uniref:Sugar transporter ERD6-like 5 n=1 Tax=Citrus sinensis TaxID=2711 RepID=A0ACB8KKC8_CITSI|nr:Sugar transporter ERD6-like 5 [Citrus sinensis]